MIINVNGVFAVKKYALTFKKTFFGNIFINEIGSILHFITITFLFDSCIKMEFHIQFLNLSKQMY